MPSRINDGLKKRCGCARKKWPKCPHPWHFSFHHRGREHRYSLDVIADGRGESPPTSKADAIVWRDRLRTEIREGTFVEPSAAPPPATADVRVTFGDVCDHYLTRHVRTPTRRPRPRREMETLIAMARRAEIPAANGTTVRLDAKPIDAVTKADVEAVRAWRRQEQKAGKSRAGAKGGEVGTNRLLSRLRHVFTWAIEEGYLTDTPFKRGPVTVVKLETSVEGARTRRLEANTAPVLLQHADAHLRALLVAALTTGCRIGELLSLQWSQVRPDEQGAPRYLVLTAAKTKTAEARVIPISLRLRAELEMRRHAPDGQDHPASAYVFGTETGERIAGIRRPWEDAVLRAHGHKPTRKRGKLTPEAQAAYQAIDLHVHDLRREFACSLLESGAALHDVQAFLGHANITTTSRYLQSAPVRLEQALTRMEQHAAGFAHHSHTGDSAASFEVPKPTSETARNSLN
jgi:integrase